MHRFYVPGKWEAGKITDLGAEESHHALRVLRLRAGDPVQLLNGAGEAAGAVLNSIKGRRASVLVESVQARPRNALEITLVMGLSKPKAMDWVIQKATELGVNNLCVVVCARSVSRPDDRELGGKAEKWTATAVEALKQCGGFWLPRMAVFPEIEACAKRGEDSELKWVAALAGSPRHPRTWLEEAARELGRFPKSAEVWIGPEGDFTQEEMSFLLAHGARPISLGDATLRSETAALYCASVLRYEASALLNG